MDQTPKYQGSFFMYRVIFIGKVKDLSSEYEKYNDELYASAKKLGGFIGLESETVDGVEITISKWQTKQDVMSWAKDPLHIEAKKQVSKWYDWYRSYHFD